MKRSDVLAIVAVLAIVLVATYYNAFVLFALVFFFPFLIWRISRKKDARLQAVPRLTIDEAHGKYGKPDGSIVVDATRANEAGGCILVYKQRRLFVIAGEPVGMDTIADVTSLNTATPYTVGQYQVVLTTTLSDRQYIRIDAGMDAEWAKDVAMEIIDAMK